MTGNAFGKPRYGRPKTDAERLKTHYALTGETTLPPRGTGIQRKQSTGIIKNPNLPSLFVGAVMGFTLYPVFKGSSVKSQFILGLLFGYLGYAVTHGGSLKDIVKSQINEVGG